MESKSISVAAAILKQDGRVLIGKRPEGGSLAGYWEFPGGKLRKGETPEACVRRECREELGVEITLDRLCYETEHHYRDENFSVHLFFYQGRILSGTPLCLAHSELIWAEEEALSDYAFCPANEGVLKQLEQERKKEHGIL